MSLSHYSDLIPEYAKDIRLNLQSVSTPEGSPGLNQNQLQSTALACALAVKDKELSENLSQGLDGSYINAAKAAASLMAMNNVYYRSLHLIEDKEYSKMPAKLRMTIIGKPGVERLDFEIMCLAVSAISGCGACINSHIHEVKQRGLSNEGVQSSLRIAAVVNAAATSYAIR